MAQFQMGDKINSTKYWTDWNTKFAMQSVARQIKAGRLAGSWPMEGEPHITHGGGPNYITAMNILCLEVYYRYLPVYQ